MATEHITNPAGWRKVRFTHPTNGSTAGLVVCNRRFSTMTVGEVSRLFPYSEATKMHKLELSPVFEDWEQAFNYQFEEKDHDSK